MRTLATVLVYAGLVLGVIAFVLALAWAVQGNSFFMYQVFAPRQEAVRRQVFEQSKSYNQGMVQELQNMEFEYAQAPVESKPALRKVILHRAADYPQDQLPPDLASFIQQLKREETLR